MSFDPPQYRNVDVFNSSGAVIAGFWQYGTVQWDDFYKYLIPFIVVSTDWSIFKYDSKTQQHEAPCPSGTKIVKPGNYVLLSTTGEPIHVGLQSIPVLRQPPNPGPTQPNTPSEETHYNLRARARDRRCLVTGVQNYVCLSVAHIFPRAYDIEWTHKGYPGKITDQADIASIGGPLKIDSVQNLITLRCDLFNSWNNNEFGIDPKNNYCITSFINGNEDFHGLPLRLDHIQDPTLRPLDELFTEHFMQGLFKFVIGPEVQGRPWLEWDNAFDAFDLSNTTVWGTKEGKELLEAALAERLFDHQLSQSIQDLRT